MHVSIPCNLYEIHLNKQFLISFHLKYNDLVLPKYLYLITWLEKQVVTRYKQKLMFGRSQQYKASVSNRDWLNQEMIFWALHSLWRGQDRILHCWLTPSPPSPWVAPSGRWSSAFGIKDYSGLRGVNRGPFTGSHASWPFPVNKDFNEISYSCYNAWTTENISVWSVKLNMACPPWEIMLISRNPKQPTACLACNLANLGNGESWI